ncbi:unnamed protein product [Moneuplotes crassus]|uniref:Uncharacterized protein n=1 Tax=Euplotes crassus TaxID=5936 RepID=A0AAD2D3I0_EUPCR|nr:unnamed protein product [Moneuplotes crassus]
MKRRTYQGKKLAPLQKTFATSKPSRPYQRFKPPKFAGTGADPNGSFLEFIKKDCARPINVRKDHIKQDIDRNHFESLQKKWAVGTKTSIIEKVDGEGKLQRNFKPVSRHHIKTDHISVIPPARDRPFQKVYDKILTRPAYDRNYQCKNIWVPRVHENKTMNNRSSVNHNIVTHKENTESGALIIGVLDKKVCNRKKGVVEVVDANRVTALKSNKDYMTAYQKNPHQFKRSNGIFSHLYDAAHRFGEDKPFKV